MCMLIHFDILLLLLDKHLLSETALMQRQTVRGLFLFLLLVVRDLQQLVSLLLSKPLVQRQIVLRQRVIVHRA